MTIPASSKNGQDEVTKPLPPQRCRIFGTGEMADRIRSHPWEQPIPDWPQALVWAINSMLESRFPTSVLWGPNLLHLYNDAYLPLTAEKHPALLGRPCAEAWQEAWHLIGPQFASVFETGSTVYREKVLIPVTRGGVVRDVYWTYSYSPLRDEQGGICGVLVVCHDVTSELAVEDKLKAVAASLTSVLDSISDGVLVLDTNWRYSYFNEQGAAMIGMKTQDLIGACVWDLFPQAEETLFGRCYREAVQSGKPVHFEEFYPAPLDKWLECHCYPSKTGLTVYFRDITEQKMSSQQIAKSEERFRFTSENAGVGYWDWDIVQDVLEWETVCKGLFGMEFDEPITYARFLAALHPDDREPTDAAVRACLAGAGAYDVEYRTVWADGSVHWLRAKGNTQLAGGKPVRMAGIVVDITAGRRDRESLERSERRLRLAQDAGRLALWEWDLSSDAFVWTGDVAGVWGREAAEIDKLAAIVDVLHPEDRESTLAAVRAATEQKMDYSQEFRVIWPDQSIHWVAARGKALYASDGEPLNMIGTHWEITDRKRSEAILLNEQARLTSFANGIPALAWMADETGSIFWYNRRWYEYTGTTLEQMQGWGWQSVHDPAFLPAVVERWSAAIESRTPFEMVFPLRGKDGIFRSFLTRIHPVEDSGGGQLQWFGTNTEIDELERTRRELATERSRLNAVIENVPVGLVFADARGNILGGNIEAERIFRHPVLLSAGIEEFGQWIAYHPDGRLVQGEEYPLARTLADGSKYTGEYLYQRGDGSRGWVTFSSAPILDAQGTLTGGVVATLDIDERKRVQDELREKNELFEIAQTAAKAGFWQYYPETGLCYLSTGSLALFELEARDEASVFPISHIVARLHPEDRDRMEQDLVNARDTGFYQSTYRVTRSHGQVCWLSGQARLMQNAQGQVYFAGFVLDVTAQKRAEEALRKSEKLAVAGRLAATISHEINNPLEAVTNLLYLVRTSTADDQTRRYATAAEEELARVTQIVTHSLRFHRSSTAATEEEIGIIVDSAAAIYRSRLHMNHVSIVRRYRAHGLVRCFNSEIRQVFGNLIGNAFDALRSEGTIFLRVRAACDPVNGRRGVRVTVADNGHGMDPQTLRRTTEPFFTTKGINGTGLGLWISRDILAKHQGVMRVKSRSEGAMTGTVFSIFLPAHPDLL